MSIEAARTIGDDAAEVLDEEIKALMQRAAPRIVALLASLDVGPDGRVRPTVENVQRVNPIMDQITANLFDDQYLEAVADYLDGMNEVSAAVSSGMREFGADPDLMAAIAKRAKYAVAAALLNTSSFSGLFTAISTQLINGIATGAEFAAISAGVRQVVEE